MVYITGDTHGIYKVLAARLEYAKTQGVSLTEKDTLLICGDFGFVLSKKEEKELEQLVKLPFNIAFVDGNHENFPKLYEYPVEEWNGGKVHRISDRIVHLMRGELFTIEGRTFFTFGGAYSTDRWMRAHKYSWWDEELPSNEEYKHAGETLIRCGYKADYILTHAAPIRMIYSMRHAPDRHEIELVNFLEWLYTECKFGHWYCGHYHEDTQLADNFTVLYEDIVALGE